MKKTLAITFCALLLTACGSDDIELAPEETETALPTSGEIEVDISDKPNNKLIERMEEVDKAETNYTSFEQEALDKGNADLCAKIENEARQNSCIYNVVANKAIKEKDSSLCNDISNEPDSDRCKDYVDSLE